MTKMLNNLITKYKSQILYLIFGVLTTVINIVVYYLLRLMHFPITFSYTIAWFLSVLFAYFTNRNWVFNSKAKNKTEKIKEFLSFYASRIITYFLGIVILLIGTHFIWNNDNAWNIIQNIVVIVANYVFSKKFVFNKN
ncbi:MAG: GtrA family protein [Lactobacillaceae bacterium]|jgi:putative flippase GtrA|nr:GtrA family protein [Lactobacillaceae bacterium]